MKNKSISNKKQVFIILLCLFVFSGIVSDFGNAFKAERWTDFITTIILWAIVFIIFWRLKDKFTKKRDEIKERFEKSDGNISITDASIYSLTSFKEIYANIPPDRKKIVQMSFVLISAALGFLLLKFHNIIYIASAGLVIVAAIGLLIWTVTAERGEINRLMDELKVARDMQMSLLPKFKPDFHSYDICGICIPAKEVGGDIFDYAILENDKLAIALMDVAGKGLDAALSCVFMSGAYSSEIKRSDDASEILNNLNKTIINRTAKGKFVTFLLTFFDPSSFKLSFVNAGLPKPILSRNGETIELNSDGIRFPLGMTDNSKYTEKKIDLINGDLFVFYTDGISEAMNAANELYSSERILELIRKTDISKLNSKEISQIIYDDVNRFVGSAEQHDDIALVVVKI